MDRYHLGVHLWRNLKAGAAGRLEWIGLITQGFAFNNLDGREPSPSAFLVHDTLGVLETPRWLGAREGLTDLRVRLALEAAVPANDPALQGWTMEGYGVDQARFPEVVLDATRAFHAGSAWTASRDLERRDTGCRRRAFVVARGMPTTGSLHERCTLPDAPASP